MLRLIFKIFEILFSGVPFDLKFFDFFEGIHSLIDFDFFGFCGNLLGQEAINRLTIALISIGEHN